VLEERISEASVTAAAKPELPDEEPEDELALAVPDDAPDPEPVDDPPAEVFDPSADAPPVPDDEPALPEEVPDDELPVPDEAPDDELPESEEAAGIVTRSAAVTVPSSAGITDVALSQAIFESVVRTLFPLPANAYPSDGVSVTYSSIVLPAENVLPSLMPLNASSVAV
jgi:hypothetical protein